MEVTQRTVPLLWSASFFVIWNLTTVIIKIMHLQYYHNVIVYIRVYITYMEIYYRVRLFTAFFIYYLFG